MAELFLNILLVTRPRWEPKSFERKYNPISFPFCSLYSGLPTEPRSGNYTEMMFQVD